MSALTFIVLAVILYGVLSSHGYARALAIAGATSAGAFFTVGSESLPTFYAVGLAGLLILGARSLVGPRIPPRLWLREIPGVATLCAFFIWSALVTLIAPLLFNGASIVTDGATNLVAGSLTNSNGAQILYLVIGIGVVVLLARSRSAGPGIIGLSLWLAMGLSLWRYLGIYAGLPFPEGLFDNTPGDVYIQTAAGGAARFRGIFTEPSSLAATAVIAVAYGASSLARARGFRRLGPLALAAVAIFLGIVSTSSTFVVAGVALVAVAAGSLTFGFLSRRTRFGVGITVVACALAIAAIWILPAVGAYVGTTVGDKIGTSSYADRTGADAESYQVFMNSWGVGVGLGAGRASSLLPTLLSTTGLVGTLLFAGAVISVAIKSFPLQRLRPVIWALVAMFIAKLVSGPDLFDPSGILWLCLGVLASGIVAQNAPVLEDAFAPLIRTRPRSMGSPWPASVLR